jgi:hypothetical protein
VVVILADCATPCRVSDRLPVHCLGRLPPAEQLLHPTRLLYAGPVWGTHGRQVPASEVDVAAAAVAAVAAAGCAHGGEVAVVDDTIWVVVR